jgi:hypothetical protein
MSILSTINKLDKYRDQIPDITDVSELQEIISSCKDLTEAYSYDLKGIPYKFQRWYDYLNNIDFFTQNTDNETLYRDILVDSVKEGSVSAIDDTEELMRDKLKELDDNSDSVTSSEASYYIGDVEVDYLITPNPSYSASAVSTPIVTDELQDTLNEDVEVNNTTISTTIVLEGDDISDRLSALVTYMNSKSRIKLIFDEVYNSVVITSINPVKDGSINSIKIGISFENIFVATTQVTKVPSSSFSTSEKSVTSSGKQGTKSVSRQTGTQEF